MTPAESLAAEFVAWCRGPGYRRAGTAEAYRKSIAAFLRETRTEDFGAVSIRVLDEYVARMQIDGLAPATVASRLWALRAFWRWAVAREYLSRNPVASIRVPDSGGDERPVVVLELRELEALFAVRQPPPERWPREPEKFFVRRCERAAGIDERDRALLRVAYDGALRIGEVASLRWADVLPPDRRDGKLRVVLPTSKRSSHHSRPIYLGDAASRSLTVWRSVARRLGRRDPRVFGLSSAGIAAAFERCAKLARIGKKGDRFPTFHILRASRATHAFEAGATERQVAELLRHRGSLESVGRYLRAATETQRRRIALLTLPENSRRVGLR